MVGPRFDAFARALSGHGTRRRLLALLTALPLAGALTTVIDEEGAAKRRGHGRRTHNHRHSGHRKDNRKGKRKKDANDDDRCARVMRAAGCRGGDIAWTCPFSVNLNGANLAGCTLSGTIVINGRVSGAILIGAVLRNTVWLDSNLSGSDLSNANMDTAILNKADVTNVIWNNTTCPDRTNSDNNGGTCCGHMGHNVPRAGC